MTVCEVDTSFDEKLFDEAGPQCWFRACRASAEWMVWFERECRKHPRQPYMYCDEHKNWMIKFVGNANNEVVCNVRVCVVRFGRIIRIEKI